jgi:ABC-type lipoprotein release transport system permease subunit
VLLVAWSLKIYRLDFKYQTDILRTLGWPSKDILVWRFCDTAIIAIAGLVMAVMMVVLLSGQLLPLLQSAPILNQGFKL